MQKTTLFALLILLTPGLLSAATVNVSSLEDLQEAIDAAQPGDQIVVADGEYTSTGTIRVATAGTADQPILITAESIGGVEINGKAGFHLVSPAAYVVIRGFVFTHQAEAMALEGEVHHCRITRNVFELEVDGRASYLDIRGHDNEVDHNLFRNKDTEGQMIYIQGPGGDAMAQRTWVHHNYFLDFNNTGKNNSTGLHIGSSWRSMSSAYSVVEYNLFVNNRGENEGAICNKSSDNIYRYNTVRDSTEISLRHGHRCQVYGNFMFDSTGLRFFGHDHKIHNNYFENCHAGINIGNGGATIPPGELTSHERPDRVQVVYNTLVNNRTHIQMSGRRNGLGSDDLVVAHNLIVGGDNPAASIRGPLKDPVWKGNVLSDVSEGAGDIPDDGYTVADPALTPGSDGFFRLPPTRAADDFPFIKIGLTDDSSASHSPNGAAEYGNRPGRDRPLTPEDVGPDAPREENRPLISAPNASFETD